MFDFNTLIALNVFGVVGFILGLYVGHRGWTGVQSDLGDVKSDLANIKGRLTPTVTITPVPAPVIVTDVPPNPSTK